MTERPARIPRSTGNSPNCSFLELTHFTHTKKACPPACSLALVIAAAEIVDEHLLHRFVVGDQDVADGASADEVADFFGEILRVVAGSLERLRHEDDLQAGLAGDVFGVLDVAEEDEVAEAIHFRIGAKNFDGLADIAAGEGVAAVGQHFFEKRRHLREVARVLGVDTSRDREGAVCETQQEVADTLEADHEFHTSEEFTGFGWADFGDGGGNSVVDFKVEGIELAFALAEGVEQGAGAGGDTFGSSACGLFGHVTGLHRAANDIVMGRFRVRTFRRSTHRCVHWARPRATGGASESVAGSLPFVGRDRQQLSISSFLPIAVNKL